MKKFAIALSALALTACGAATTDQPTAPAGPPVDVSAADLSKAFQANEAKAQLTYKGKTLRVSGTVKDIDLDFSDEPVIKLRGSGDVGGMGISQDGKSTDVHVAGLTSEQAAEINKGTKMIFVCTELSEIMGSPQLGTCAIDQPAAAPKK